MKKLLSVILSMCLVINFFALPCQCLTFEQTITHLEEMERGLGIKEGSVEVILCDYDTVVACGYDPFGVVGWANNDKIYLNKFYIRDADYVWTVAHELTHIKQMQENRCNITEKYYYLKESYSDLDFEQEAESVASFYFFYYNFGLVF